MAEDKSPGPTLTRSVSETTGARVKTQFQYFDLNQNGTIDRSELLNVLQGIDAKKWTEERVDAILKSADVNRDGVIQYEEFLDYILKDGDNNAELRQAATEMCSPKAVDTLVRTLSGMSDKEGRTSVTKALEELQAAPWEKKESAMNLLLKLLQNVVKDPTNPKFRRLKRSNKVLAEKVFSVPGCAEFLLAAGFEDIPEGQPGSGDELVLPDDIDVGLVVEALTSFGDQEIMDKLRAERDARIAKHKAEDAKHKELKGGVHGGDEAEKARILAAAEYDRQERDAKAKLAAEGYREENQVSAEKGGRAVTGFKEIGIDINSGGG